MQSRLPSSEMTKNRQKKRITQSQFAEFVYRQGIFQIVPGESSCPGGSKVPKGDIAFGIHFLSRQRVFKAELQAAEVDPHLKTKQNEYCLVQKNRYSLNFQNITSKTNERLLIAYEKPLIHFGTNILKIVAVSVILNTS